MKKYIFCFSIFCFFLCSGCYEDDIVSSKPGREIDPVNNLNYNKSGEDVILTWELPSDYPDDINEPVSVQINVSVNGAKEGGAIVLENNPHSYTYSNYNSSESYRFTVKVMANMKKSDPYISDLWYSKGKTINF